MREINKRDHFSGVNRFNPGFPGRRKFHCGSFFFSEREEEEKKVAESLFPSVFSIAILLPRFHCRVKTRFRFHGGALKRVGKKQPDFFF